VFEVPVLETNRLTLRGHQISDFDECKAMWADPFVTRYIGGQPYSEQQTWSRLLNYIGHWALMNFGFWAVIEKSTQKFIGEIGFANFKRSIEPSIKDFPELGWVLVSAAHGKGYATEALHAAIAWGDMNLKASRSVCIVQPENLASLRVAHKCGYQEICSTTYNGQAVLIFERNIPQREKI